MNRQFPLGKFQYQHQDLDLTPYVARLETFPQRLAAAWDACPPELRDAPYREGGWTRRTVVHHMADSHLNMYVRIKLALTEDEPTVKPYDENAWATLPDGPVELSLQLIAAVHGRAVPLFPVPGVAVREVDSGSPAEKKLADAGDISRWVVSHVDGKAVTDPAAFRAATAGKASVKLTLTDITTANKSMAVVLP